MANTIKFKRGSGSDPGASDLAVGELAIRTDEGKIFTKKDDGSVAEISGSGGTDFVYLALRNADNDGVASYPAADFTLVESGSTTAYTVTAANTLLVSYGGVIQEPNEGTSTPSSGFAISGTTIKFGSDIAAAPDFIIYQKGAGIGIPSDNSVDLAQLAHATQGDVLYYGSSGVPARLGAGTSGYYLKTQGSGANPVWAEVSAGVTSDAQENTVAGTNAGDSFTGTDALYNTLFGYNTGTAITTGDHNHGSGSEALLALTTGGRNVALGYRTLKTITTTGNNIAIGHSTLMSGSGFEYTIALGSDAGGNQTGNHNIWMGNYTGRAATGNNNVGIGKNVFNPFGSGVSGSDNVAIGIDAASVITSGSDNTILGSDAGDALTTGSNNIILGHDAAASAVGVSNEITLGDTAITKFRVPGLNFAIKDTTATEDYVLTVDANGEAGWEAAGGGTALTGSTNNTITTVTGADAIQGEANLTFDGTTLTASTDVKVQGGSGDTTLELHRTNAAGSNGNAFGNINWSDNNNNQVASIRAVRESAVDDAKIHFSTRPAGGSVTDRMSLDSSGNLEVTGNQTTTLAVQAQGFECPATVSANWTIGANNNAMFPGPMTVASGITVTVPANRTLTIV